MERSPPSKSEFPENGFIVDNNFFSHYLLLLYKVGEAGGAAAVFVPQDMQLGVADRKGEREAMFMNSRWAMSRWKRQRTRPVN